MKKMKIFIAIMAVALLLASPVTHTYAQTMTFGTTIDANNNPTDFATTFTIASSGSYIYVVVTLPGEETFNTHHIQYDIYKNGTYSTAITQDIDPTWGYCYKKIIFYSGGDYRIDAYDMDRYNSTTGTYGVWICTGYVTMNLQ